MPTGQRIKVTFKDGQPVGEEGCSLSHFFGILSRLGEYAPLNYSDWRLMPQINKEDVKIDTTKPLNLTFAPT
uniref:Uncharacterized protein n=1 Tax=Nelumbo nucifera TaxID=4432 RepID=A0A822YU01_NELNU|nr:TPA_asm: hypothetical protein HUJ06_008225 [Nelumbo nucifera]